MKTSQILPRISVASGSYVVSEWKKAILEANLGTCVGVSLCDRQRGVGGLIHLLLPEPTNPLDPWQSEIYASTGLPLFIQLLLERGARREGLEATVAGGALMGPLSKKDMILNIGGRTAEIVERILRQESIAVLKSEIGGYFSCCLSLNLETWESEIVPLGISTITAEGEDVKRPVVKKADRLIHFVKPIPQIALKIVRMISEQASSYADIAQEIMQDQVLSAKVIGFCNSAYTAAKARVDSIERALLVVGEKWVLQMIVAAALEEFFSQSEEGYSLCKGGLFKHACGTAAAARTIAEFTGKARPDLAYTAGLLHDIGKVSLDQNMYTERPLFYRYVQASDAGLIEAESRLFGTTHTEVGGELALHWSIPETLVEAIRHHHQPERATVMIELTHIVYFADLIMSRFVVGQELEKLDTGPLASRLSFAGLTPELFVQLIGKIPFAALELPLPGFHK